MNTRTLKSLAALLLCTVFVSLFYVIPAVAQTVTPAAPSDTTLIAPETAAAIATPLIVTAAVKFPWILTALAAIGAFRFFFKPIVSLIESYVRSTPSTNDDELYDKATHSAWFKWLAWFLDFAFSIKVGPQFTAKPEDK